MKKIIVVLLIFLMSFGTGFCGERLSSEEPVELDARIKTLFEGAIISGDVKFLSDGNLAFQMVEFGAEDIKRWVAKVDIQGNLLKRIEIPMALEGSGEELFFGFVVEDANGNLFTNGERGVYRIDPDFSEVKFAMEFQPLMSFAESKDQVMINLFMDMEKGKGGLAALTYPEGSEPIDPETGSFYALSGRTFEHILDLMGIENGEITGAAFADATDEVYILASEADEEREIWKVGRVAMTLVEGAKDDLIMDLVLEETIILEGMESIRYAMPLKYDGEGFQLSGFEPKSRTSKIMRFDRNGKLVDTIEVPGLVNQMDVKGNQTVIAMSSMPGDGGCYLIEWKTKSGSGPRRLIQERSRNGKTIAVFRDGGYGLLRREDPESGAVDYLAPLRTEEKEVRLRMPLCDVLAKAGGAAQNLEILYGDDRIQISITALAVQELLEQMPCETDATVEIHLMRGQDGNVKVTAELFVVEQVDSMTKVVHRLPVPLP